jgi:hypothetical protein
VSTTTTGDTGTVAINIIRGLYTDAIQKANSGHRGTRMLERAHGSDRAQTSTVGATGH